MKKTIEAKEILRQLNCKFNLNFNDCLDIVQNEPLEEIIYLSKAISSYSKIFLKNNKEINPAQKEICLIIDEIFIDINCSIYFFACGIDIPAQMLLRRSLELGIGFIYLWDLPHVFYAWTDLNKDLIFQKMIEHLNSEEYKILINKINHSFDYKNTQMIDDTIAKELYRDLSNVIHGKMFTFESGIPQRFKFIQEDYDKGIALIKKIELLLLDLWNKRFQDIGYHLLKSYPKIENILNKL